MALPSLIKLMDWDIDTNTTILSEEETHSSPLTIFEKTIPKTLCVHDFIKFFKTVNHDNSFYSKNERLGLDPHLTIFSPPPEA